MFALIVFDLDGTLVDSKRDIADAANATLVACGAPALPEERSGRMVGNGARRSWSRAPLPRLVARCHPTRSIGSWTSTTHTC
jgi:phosphoglycolate phosphatase-like HAD superfamily hydrolase